MVLSSSQFIQQRVVVSFNEAFQQLIYGPGARHVVQKKKIKNRVTQFLTPQMDGVTIWRLFIIRSLVLVLSKETFSKYTRQ